VEKFKSPSVYPSENNATAMELTQPSSFNHVPIVSIILPTYNRAHSLERAIRSVLVQTLSNFELIVVDDGSTDDTAHLVERFGDSRIRLLSLGRNYGAGRARNKGIEAAAAEFVAFLDSDDEWMPRKLELQVARLRATNDPRVTVAYCLEDLYFEATNNKVQSQGGICEGDLFDHLLGGLWLSTSILLVKRSSMVSIGGFDESLPSFQDYDLCLRLAQASNYFVAVNEPLAVRYCHTDSRISNDPTAALTGFQNINHKWGSVMKSRLGATTYDRWVSKSLLRIQDIQVKKAVREGKRLKAFRYCLAMSRFLPFSAGALSRGLLLVGLGQDSYLALVRAKNSRVAQTS
jgi:glycosyltransferase involved in cell wall biosynthesis